MSGSDSDTNLPPWDEEEDADETAARSFVPQPFDDGYQPPGAKLPERSFVNEPRQEIVFDQSQIEAIAACCDPSRRVVAITGPAGTGKTKLIEEVARRLTAAGYSVQASAPTGKAAKRIRESTGLTAMTNHRMLEYGMPYETELDEEDKHGKVTKKYVRISTGPLRNQRNPLPYDFILCDEYAMVNRTIHSELIFALRSGARIRMFGDVNQLKPIEEYSSLNSTDDKPSAFQTALKKFDGIVLTTIHRTNEGSGIAKNCKEILKGNIPKRTEDCQIMYSDQPVDALTSLVRSSLHEGIDYSTTDAQIITSMNKSWIGTSKLNPVIQNLFWDRSKPFIELPRPKFKFNQHDKNGKKIEPPAPIRIQVGSKIVYTANVYDLGTGQSVFNGEVGIVADVDFEIGMVTVDFGDRMVSIPPLCITANGTEFDPRSSIDLAYVLTTHKVQGSEYKYVCVILNKSTSFMQSRRNFYTACSRARLRCTVITDQVSIMKSVRVPG